MYLMQVCVEDKKMTNETDHDIGLIEQGVGRYMLSLAKPWWLLTLRCVLVRSVDVCLGYLVHWLV